MAIDKKFMEKYNVAYQGIPKTVRPIEFAPDSPFYHMEEWRWVDPRFVPGVIPNMYKVSSFGRIYTYRTSPKYPNGGIMKPSLNQKGYHQINLLSIEGKKICVKVHRLVLLHFTFIPDCQNYEVDHLDGNKDNNALWNLQWVSAQENTHRAIINNQRPISCKTGYYNGDTTLLSDTQARELFAEIDNMLETRCTIDYKYLTKKYKVDSNYINGLRQGSIRPYIRKEYLQSRDL